MNKKRIVNKYSREIRKIVEGLKKYEPEKIILFGSAAQADLDEESDLDLFLIKKSKKRRIDRARDARRFIEEKKVPVDIIVYTPEEVRTALDIGDFFVEDILSTGKVLYETKKRPAT